MKRQILPDARSWVEVPPESHFPIQNLPFARLSFNGNTSLFSRIGDQCIDLEALRKNSLLTHPHAATFEGFQGLSASDLGEVRSQLFDLLIAGSAHKNSVVAALMHESQTVPQLPTDVGNFVDFYSGIHHASNVGKMFRPDQPPLLPNYLHLPVGYNGRASSLRPDRTEVKRPRGQFLPQGAASPIFAPTEELDFELEVGFIIGSDHQQAIPVHEAESFMLGLVLVNDWSARDLQRWEYQPLGPFLAKSFCTTVGTWVVTLDSFVPFRTELEPERAEPLPHLKRIEPAGFNIELEVHLKTAKMTRPQKITSSNTRYLYWGFAQQLAHQTSNGTPIVAGDLYASGTISGPYEGQWGSLLEATWRGTKPLALEETGETRTFLQAGDEVTLIAFAQGDGYRVGFGTLTSKVSS